MDTQTHDKRSTEVIRLAPVPVLLPASSPRRLPRRPERARPSEFHRAFEDSILYYDAFHYPDERILMIGPPPHNLSDLLKSARYVALPSGKMLSSSLFPSRSTMITELTGVPPGTDALLVRLDEQDVRVEVGSNYLESFANSRLLFTINQNNALDWIRRWGLWHAQTQGTDAIVIFDNGSNTYSLGDLSATLSGIPGISKIAVVSLPHKFGPLDHWVKAYHFWPRFLQISATAIALRRFGLYANGLINCDIDELMWAVDSHVYDLARGSRHGVLRVPGRWIEAVAPDGPPPRDHLGFRYRLRDIRARLSPPKWVLDPSRAWVKSLSVHPYHHRVHRAPFGARFMARGALFWHFKGINTNWKENRASTVPFNPTEHIPDETWIAAMTREPDHDIKRPRTRAAGS